MNENTLVTICWAVVGVFMIQATLIYSITRLFVTGKTLFERARRDEDEPSRIHRVS